MATSVGVTISRIGPSETGHRTDDVFKWMKIKLYMKKSDKTRHRHIFLQFIVMVMTNVTEHRNAPQLPCWWQIFQQQKLDMLVQFNCTFLPNSISFKYVISGKFLCAEWVSFSRSPTFQFLLWFNYVKKKQILFMKIGDQLSSFLYLNQRMLSIPVNKFTSLLSQFKEKSSSPYNMDKFI